MAEAMKKRIEDDNSGELNFSERNLLERGFRNTISELNQSYGVMLS